MVEHAATLGNFRGHEIAIAAAVALAVQAGAALALRSADLSRPAAAPDIEKGIAVPVKVIPVLDLDSPLLKLGGRRDPTKLPDRWVRQAPKVRAEQNAFVTTKAGQTEADIPSPEIKVADAGTEPPPPDAEITKEVDLALNQEIDAGPPANVDVEGHQDGVAEGTETDPLKARAVDLYRARIIGWFSSRFRVSGSGLSPEDLAKHRVGATVTLSDDRRVTSYSITPSGNAAFDAAAVKTLEAAKGDTIPPPPENYPDVVQHQIRLTFVCREDRCD
jgi:outer membrane biosynthesis protein TonB